jgi:hypothetical protein
MTPEELESVIKEQKQKTKRLFLPLCVFVYVSEYNRGEER